MKRKQNLWRVEEIKDDEEHARDVYRIYRLIDKRKPDTADNREYYGLLSTDRKSLQKYADELNAKKFNLSRWGRSPNKARKRGYMFLKKYRKKISDKKYVEVKQIATGIIFVPYINKKGEKIAVVAKVKNGKTFWKYSLRVEHLLDSKGNVTEQTLEQEARLFKRPRRIDTNT